MEGLLKYRDFIPSKCDQKVVLSIRKFYQKESMNIRIAITEQLVYMTFATMLSTGDFLHGSAAAAVLDSALINHVLKQSAYYECSRIQLVS